MALEVWFQEDIAETIVATVVGMLTAAAAQGALNAEYCRGVIDCARTLGLNYRISWPMLHGQLRAALADVGHEELLDLLATKMPVVQMLPE